LVPIAHAFEARLLAALSDSDKKAVLRLITELAAASRAVG
jgi:hypothetical protein